MMNTMKLFKTCRLFGFPLLGALVSFSAIAADAPQKKIVIFRSSGAAFKEVGSILSKDLSKRYVIKEIEVDKTYAQETFDSEVTSQAPDLLVLMDNLSVSLANKYNLAAKKKIKGVALMGLNLKGFLKGNDSISGIAYEVPAFTLLTRFRFISETPIKKVAVLYRRSLFGADIDSAKQLLKSEGIELDATNVEEGGGSTEQVQAAVRAKLPSIASGGTKADAIWVMLDSVLLSGALFKEVWLPAAHDSKMPFLAGIEDFAKKELNFCTYAMSPSLSDLGSQASQMIDSILRDGSNPKDLGVEELIAVNAVVNMPKAETVGWKLKMGELNEIRQEK